jgi:hypothetical protein
MSRYRNIPQTTSPDGKLMYKTVRYPEIPRSFEDIYVYTTIGDRYDTLALQFYQDSSLWWIIAIANGTLIQDSLTPPVGTQLRIPSNTTPYLTEYKKINE